MDMNGPASTPWKADRADTAESGTHSGKSETRLLATAAKGGAVGFAGSVGGKLLGILLQILVCRIYGAGHYGLFVTGILVTQIVQVIAALGLNKGGMRFLSIAHEKGDWEEMLDIFKTACVFPLVLGVSAGFACYAGAPFIGSTCFKDHQMVDVLRQFAYAVPFFAFLRIGADLSRAFKTAKYAVFVEDFLFFFLQIAVFLILNSLGVGFNSVIYSFVFSAIFCSLLMMFIVRIQIQRYRGKSHRSAKSARRSVFPREWRHVMGYSLPLIPMGLLFIVGMSIDILMLNILTDSSRVGEYAAAARWVFFVTIIFRPVNLIMAPLIAGQFGLDQMHQVKVLYSTGTRWIFLMTLTAVVFQMIAREPLMSMFGKEFVETGPTVLAILLVGVLFSALSNSASNLLTMSGHQYRELVVLCSRIFLNVCLNLLLIPRYGILGAAVATAMSHMVTDMIRLVIVYRCLGMHPFSDHLTIPAATGIVFCLGGLYFNTLFQPVESVQVAVAFFASAVMSWVVLVRGLDSHDRDLLAALKIRMPVIKLRK